MHEYKGYDPEPCAYCGTDTDPTQHHIFPRAFKFKHSLQDMCIWLCDFHHRMLEKKIERHEKQFGEGPNHARKRLPTWFYPYITLKFITQKSED